MSLPRPRILPLLFAVLLLSTAAAAASHGIQAIGRASFLALLLMGYSYPRLGCASIPR